MYFMNFILISIIVYSINETDLILFQHRSPIIEGKGKKYIEQLSLFITSNEFSKVIIIGGLDSSVQTPELVGKYKYLYLI